MDSACLLYIRNSLTFNTEPSYVILEYQIRNDQFFLGLDVEYLPYQINNFRSFFHHNEFGCYILTISYLTMHYPECPECIELLRYDTIGSLKCGKFSWTVPGNIFSPIPIPSIQSYSSNSTLSPYLIHSSKRQTITFYTKNFECR